MINMNTIIYNIEENSSKNNQLFFVKFIEGFFMKRLSTFLVLIVLLLAYTTSSWAATLTVGPAKMYATIQAAVNAASGGDVVEVYTAVYAENVTIPGGKNGLSILAATGNTPILDGTTVPNPKVGFRIYSDYVSIKGFVIQHYSYSGGTDVYSDPTVRGAGIESMIATYQHVISENTIRYCNWGILVSEGNNITVKDNYIGDISKTTSVVAPIYLTQGGFGIIFISNAVAMEHNTILRDTVTSAETAGIVYGRLAGSVGSQFTVIKNNYVRNSNSTSDVTGYVLYNIQTSSAVDFSGNLSFNNGVGLFIHNSVPSDNDDVSIMNNTFSGTNSTREVISTSDYPGSRMYDILANTGNVFNEGAPATSRGAIAALQSDDAVVENAGFRYIRNDLAPAVADAKAYVDGAPSAVRVFVMDGYFPNSSATVNLANPSDNIKFFRSGTCW